MIAENCAFLGPLPRASLLLVLLMLAACSSLVLAQEERELHPNGQTKRVYRLDSEGKIHGSYVEFFENGRVKIRARYSHGIHDGKYESFREKGRLSERVYDKGQLWSLSHYDKDDKIDHCLKRGRDGLAIINKGHPDISMFPRSIESIVEKVARIDVVNQVAPSDRIEGQPSCSEPFSSGKLGAVYLEDAVRHINGYRFLANLPHDLQLDERLTRLAQHAALVCKLNGTLSHTPKRPEGISDELFSLGSLGAGQCNLHAGQSSLREAVDGFMDDSDNHNIAHVGHRRWLLSPGLKQTGLGQVGGFVAIHVHDDSERATRPLMVSFPSPGYYPVEYITDWKVAWHFGWDLSRVRVADGETVRVKLSLLDESYDIAERLDAENVSIDMTGLGNMAAIVFRPAIKKDQFKPGLRILVEIEGLLLPKKQLPNYVVELFSMKALE